MTKLLSPYSSELMPQRGNAFTRWIGRSILKLLGWKITGQLPNKKKAIIIGGPHTSNWDFIIMIATMLTVGMRLSWLMKKEAFFWPLGRLWIALGGIPVNRKKSMLTPQMAQWLDDRNAGWIGLAPEGTRSNVKAFKKGYLRMAYAAKAPVFIIGIRSRTKEVVLDKIWDLTYDINIDNREIKAYYDKNFIGIRAKSE